MKIYFMKEIEPPYTEKKQKPIYNPIMESRSGLATDIMRIVQEEELTRIDFVVHSKSFSWVSIERETFIQPINTGLKLVMVRAVNIPIAPVKHLFKNRSQVLILYAILPCITG